MGAVLVRKERKGRVDAKKPYDDPKLNFCHFPAPIVQKNVTWNELMIPWIFETTTTKSPTSIGPNPNTIDHKAGRCDIERGLGAGARHAAINP